MFRARRAWLPPSALWLFKPRNYQFDIGGLDEVPAVATRVGNTGMLGGELPEWLEPNWDHGVAGNLLQRRVVDPPRDSCFDRACSRPPPSYEA